MAYRNLMKKKNYEAVGQSCTACNKAGEGMVTYHHIYRRKTYPEYANAKWNQIPLCLECHNKVHNKGDMEYFRTSDKVRSWMIKNGWYEQFGKLLNKNVDNA